MRFTVKLVACLALVILIGFSATYALLLSTFGTKSSPSPSPTPTETITQGETGSKPQFDVDVVYAYAGPGDSSSHSHFGMTVHPLTLYPSVVYFNFTHVSNAESESCDAKFEVYLIQMSSDKGSTETYAYYEGTNYNPSLDMIPYFSLDTFIDTGPTSGIIVGGGFRFNWTTNTSSWGSIGSYGSYGSGESGLGLWSAGQPDAIFVSVRRLGWVTVNGTSTFATLASAEDIVQVKLEKFGDGFLYNKIVPEDKLSQIDLFRPPI
jgi:hypothetical protein